MLTLFTKKHVVFRLDLCADTQACDFIEEGSGARGQYVRTGGAGDDVNQQRIFKFLESGACTHARTRRERDITSLLNSLLHRQSIKPEKHPQIEVINPQGLSAIRRC